MLESECGNQGAEGLEKGKGPNVAIESFRMKAKFGRLRCGTFIHERPVAIRKIIMCGESAFTSSVLRLVLRHWELKKERTQVLTGPKIRN
jgi:hypothetical protein